MRIQGRVLRASNLAERRVLKTLGVDQVRVPRKQNPFAVARHIKKLATGTGGNLPELRAVLAKAFVGTPDAPTVPVIPALPDSRSTPRDEARAA